MLSEKNTRKLLRYLRNVTIYQKNVSLPRLFSKRSKWSIWLIFDFIYFGGRVTLQQMLIFKGCSVCEEQNIILGCAEDIKSALEAVESAFSFLGLNPLYCKICPSSHPIVSRTWSWSEQKEMIFFRYKCWWRSWNMLQHVWAPLATQGLLLCHRWWGKIRLKIDKYLSCYFIVCQICLDLANDDVLIAQFNRSSYQSIVVGLIQTNLANTEVKHKILLDDYKVRLQLW